MLLEPEGAVKCKECDGTVEVEMGSIGATVEAITLDMKEE